MLNPIRSPQRALARRNLVLSRMLQLGMIQNDEYKQAVNEPIVTRYHATSVGLDAPYLAEMVRKFMLDTYGEESYSKGYQVYTTISSAQQQAAQIAVFKGLLDYDIRHGYRGRRNIFGLKVPPGIMNKSQRILPIYRVSNPLNQRLSLQLTAKMLVSLLKVVLMQLSHGMA